MCRRWMVSATAVFHVGWTECKSLAFVRAGMDHAAWIGGVGMGLGRQDHTGETRIGAGISCKGKCST